MNLELHYPTIAKLKQIELDIELNINAYQDAHATYVNNIKQGLTKQARLSLSQMDKINNDLISLLGNAEKLMEIAYPKGVSKQELTKLRIPDINSLSIKLNRDAKEIKKITDEINDIEGNLSVSSITQQSNYIQYFVMFILTIIVIGLTAHTILTDTSSNIENIILLLAIVSIVYYLYYNYIIN
jgi:hypothetical protein